MNKYFNIPANICLSNLLIWSPIPPPNIFVQTYRRSWKFTKLCKIFTKSLNCVKPSLPHGFQEWINNYGDDDDVDLGASVNWLAVSCIEVSQTNKAGEGGGWSDDDDDDDYGYIGDHYDDDDGALPGVEEKMNKRKDKARIPLAARV